MRLLLSEAVDTGSILYWFEKGLQKINVMLCFIMQDYYVKSKTKPKYSEYFHKTTSINYDYPKHITSSPTRRNLLSIRL